MGDRHDYVALEWVKGEIAETLKVAHQAIVTLLDDPQATHALSECLACIHQVHGSLQMVEFYGAALFAEEMEQLTRALLRHRVSLREEAIHLLLQALGQLPIYLDRVQGARRDLPLVMLPLINDLRTARGESLLSETSLFIPQLPDLPPLDEESLALLEPADLPDVLRKLRQMLQMALAGLLREQDEETNLGYLAQVFARLEGLCGPAPLGPLWQVASALVEGMRSGALANSPALRSLFKEADQELKRLLERGMPGINQPAPPMLLKRLLFYIAKAEHPTGQMLTMKDRYGLDDALPDSAMVDEERARLAGPDRDAMRSVLAALCEELVRVKERLDLFVRSDRQHTSDLDSLLAPLRQIADTLAVLGFGQPRKVIIDQLAVVLSLAQGQREPNDAILMDVAGALLYVEATLAGMVGTVEPQSQEESRLPTTDLTQIHQIVIKEARICLQQAKDMIVDYIDADWDRQHLQPLPALLTQVRGALAMIPLSRAASLIETCNQFIHEHLLLDPDHPGWQELDSLADIVTSIEYYLERLGDDPDAPGEHLLDVAQKSLASLGFFPSEQQVPVLEEVLSPTQAQVMRDHQELDDPALLQTLADVLGSPVSADNPPADEVTQDVAALDPVLLEIFRNEAETHLGSLNRFLDRAAEQVPLQASDELQRALHTLKGSASMAGVLPIAELAAPLDQLTREYKAHLLALDLDEVELLLEAEGLFRLGLRQLKRDPLAGIPGARSLIERTQALLAERLQSLLSAPNAGLRIKRDPQLINNFLAQGMDILLDAESLLRRWQEHPGERQELSALLDELTTLGEGAHLADLHPVDELCEALLDLYGAVEESSLAVSERFFHEAQSAHEALINMLDELAAGQEVSPQPERIQALRGLLDEGLDPSAMGLIRSDGSRTLSIRELGSATAELAQTATEFDPPQSPVGAGLSDRRTAAKVVNDDAFSRDKRGAWESFAGKSDRRTAAPTGDRVGLDDEIVAIFLEEAVDILDSAGQALQRWLADPDNAAPLLSLQRDLHTLKGGARMADVDPVGDLAHELENLYEGLVDRRFSHGEALAQLLQHSHDRLAELLEQLQNQQPLTDPGELIDVIRHYRQDNARTLERVEPAPANDSAAHDPELQDIFLEEGFDIIENSGAALVRWQAEPTNRQEVETLLRDLHTLKGGARMVEIVPIGDLAHELEFLYEGLSAGVLQATPALFALLQSSHDRLAQMLDATRAGDPLPAADQLIDAIRNYSHPAVPEAPAVTLATHKPEPLVLPPDAGADMVKVSAELLDDLVNLAGETSIFRGRIEQQVNDARVALSEMETTIERMRDQLRRLDTETQGRILSRQQVDAERLGYEEFDPLEMDRHSQLQQLSRALFESASDLLDLKETLDRRNQDAENLLQQQGRINTELQEGLMRTRMVPFERMLPRLKRIVRQVSSELGKDVEFIVGNAEGEMDRNVLERMAAPLEHMLRNAVDHGLESAEVRIAAGKPAQGRITLDLSREGGDIIFDIRDDGAGVPLDAVRRKAITRGLLAPDNHISDRDVLQFILQPGFSTAEKITQISGRGVGMDVVHEEVRQLGGTMSIDSVPGQGVHFRIRLPFTVSVNRALMVQCGEDQYAIPLNTIDGIVRVLPNELEGHYRLDPPTYNYAGQHYELCYLGELLKTSPRPKLLGQSLPLPVLLVQCNERHIAVQVDAMAGTREIVVKSLGPQFAAVQGLSGATILGDGRVVLIVDLLAPIRAMQARVPQRPLAHDAEPEPHKPLLVLVVDDSVTVRKVTSRLLERHGMNVLTAKDGVDAMVLLEEHLPDLMLLDIEMPRMDGFEVATRVRADERLRHLPIIMITSRTGQKHRDRAMAIGVNDYLGKPYQESVLLDSIALWSKTHA